MSRIKRLNGFTIIELLVVIVVIAILATLTIVSYNVVQIRSRDAKVRTAAGQVQSALDTYISQNGRIPRGGSNSIGILANGDCNVGSTGMGWIAKGNYPCTVEEILVAADLIPNSLISGLPPNKVLGSSTKVFQLYDCITTTTKSSLVLMWYLESPSAEETTNYASYKNATTCPNLPTPYTQYDLNGMRAAVLIDK